MNNTTMEETQDQDERWRRAEVTSALVHLYYLRGGSYDPTKLPRGLIAELMGISRYTAMRAMQDAKLGLDVAVRLHKELAEYDLEQERKAKEREYKKRFAKEIRNAKEREKRRKKKELQGNDPSKRKGAERRNNGTLRQLQEARAVKSGKPAGRNRNPTR